MSSARRIWTAAGVAIVALLAGVAIVLAQENEAGVDITARAGVEFTKTLATFETSEGGVALDAFSATIDWGDGVAGDEGVIVETTGTRPSCPGTTDQQCFAIEGTHTYAQTGDYRVFVKLFDADKTQEHFTVSPSATVRDYAGIDLSATVGKEFSGPTASFTDPGGTTAADFSASIDWGDGTPPTAGTISQIPSGYEVAGKHTYSATGSFTVETTVNGPGSSEAVSSTATVAEETGPGPEPQPEPEPEPEPEPQLTAAMFTHPATPAPGTLVTLDASHSTGKPVSYDFDIDGNGTFETKCAKPAASVVYTDQGQFTPGVMVRSADDQQTTSSSVSVTNPPPKAIARYNGAILGGCTDALSADALNDAQAILKCPKTVKVGVGELVFPPDASPAACFELSKVFFDLGIPALLTGASARSRVSSYVAPPGQAVLLNGLRLEDPTASRFKGPFHDGRIAVALASQRLFVTGKTLTESEFRFDIRLKGSHIYLWEMGVYQPWDLSRSSFVAPVDFNGGYFGLDPPDHNERLLLLKDGQTLVNISLVAPEPLGVLTGEDWDDTYYLGPKDPRYATSFPFTVTADNTWQGVVPSKSPIYFGDLVTGDTDAGGSIVYSIAKQVRLTPGLPGLAVSTLFGPLEFQLFHFKEPMVLRGNYRIESGELGGTARPVIPGAGLGYGSQIRIQSLEMTLHPWGFRGSSSFATPYQVTPGFPLMRGTDAAARIGFFGGGIRWTGEGLRVGQLPLDGNYKAKREPFVEGDGWAPDSATGDVKIDVPKFLLKGVLRVRGNFTHSSLGGRACLKSLAKDPCEKGIRAYVGSKGIAHCFRSENPILWYLWSGTSGTSTVSHSKDADFFARRDACESRARKIAGSKPHTTASRQPHTSARLKPRGAKPKIKLRAKRRGTNLRIRWNRLRGVRGYLVGVRLDHGFSRFYRLPKGRRKLTIRDVPPGAGGRIVALGIQRKRTATPATRLRLRPRPAIKAPRSVSARTARRNGFTLTCTSSADGTCAAVALHGGKLVAQGVKEMAVNRTTKLRLRLTRAGKRILKRVGKGNPLRLRVLADIPGEGRVSKRTRVVARS